MDIEAEHEKNDLSFVIAQLRARKGTWRQIEVESGLDYAWLSKVARGVTVDPGYKKVTRAAAYFRMLERQRSDRAAVFGDGATTTNSGAAT